MEGKRLLKDALASSGPRPVSVFITIFLTPLMVNHLGQEAYGVWALTGSLLAYTGLLALGLNSAISYYVPQSLVKQDHRSVNEVISTVFACYCLAGMLSLAIGVLLTWKISDWFNIPLALQAPARTVAALLAFNVMLQIPLSVYKGLLGSLQRWDVLAIVTIASEVLRAISIVVAFTLGFGLVALAAVSVSTHLGAAFVFAMLAYRFYPELALKKRHLTFPLLPRLVNYSLNTLMYTASQVIMLQSGKTLTGLLLGPAAVTVFAIPFTMLIMLSQMVQHAAQTLRPVAATLQGQGSLGRIGKLYLSATKYSLVVAAPSAVLFILLGETLLKVWIGDEFTSDMALVLVVLTVPQMLRAVNTSGFFVLSGLGQHRFFGRTTLLQSLVSVVLSYLLAGPAGLGLLGVALGISIPELVVSGVLLPRHMLRALDVNVAELGASGIRAVLAALPFALSCLMARRVLEGATRIELLFALTLLTIPFVLGVWFLALTSDERRLFKGFVFSNADGSASDLDSGADI